MYEDKRRGGLGAYVFGIISLFTWIVPHPLGWPTAVSGIALGLRDRKKYKKARIGLFLACVGMVMTIVWWIAMYTFLYEFILDYID